MPDTTLSPQPCHLSLLLFLKLLLCQPRKWSSSADRSRAPFLLPGGNVVHWMGKQLYLFAEVVPCSLPETAAYNKVWDGSGHLCSCTWVNEWKLLIKIIGNYCLSGTCFQGCPPWVHFPSSSPSRSFRPIGKLAPLLTAVTVLQWFCILLFPISM